MPAWTLRAAEKEYYAVIMEDIDRIRTKGIFLLKEFGGRKRRCAGKIGPTLLGKNV